MTSSPWPRWTRSPGWASSSTTRPETGDATRETRSSSKPTLPVAAVTPVSLLDSTGATFTNSGTSASASSPGAAAPVPATGSVLRGSARWQPAKEEATAAEASAATKWSLMFHSP
jgi:hypothetical protein